MPSELFVFDPGDTSDRTYVVPRTGPVKLEVCGAAAHYRDDDPEPGFAGLPFGQGDLLVASGIVLEAGDELTIRLGGPGSGGAGGFNGGGSSPSPATDVHYGMGGGGCTEISKNGELWIVAGGGPGGFRYQIEDFVEPPSDVMGPVLPFDRFLLGAPRPGPTEDPRIPFIQTAVGAWDPHDEVAGAVGGEHDGADGVANDLLGPLDFAWTTGAGGGGYGGGASGGFAWWVADFDDDDLADDEIVAWRYGRPGGSLVPGLGFTSEIEHVFGAVGAFYLELGRGRGWSVGSVGIA